jgi:PiT family inorganic phosphate transporter
MLVLLISLALIYAFINGYRDASGIMAGVIASRALPPGLALVISAVSEFIAPFLFGTAVARSVATGLVDPAQVSLETIVIAMVAALAWTLFAFWRGIPSSASHALIGGLLGAALLLHGPSSVKAGGLLRVVLPLFLAPPVGLLVGYLFMLLILWLFRAATPRVNTLFRRLQIVTMIGLALTHSANDAQKSMGMIALGLVLAGDIDVFRIPPGVVAACAIAIALGASRADWRLIHTLGFKIYRIRPVNALASQSASSAVIFASGALGAPVSTSQVISMALMGAGAAERVNKVRWQIGAQMIATWLLTIPATTALAAALYALSIAALRFDSFLRLFVAWLAAS